jgi:hypothetical protein
MGYLQALQLLTRAYKAARGVMPKGLDLLKLKQKARQKVIDSKKVINVDFSKGRKFYEEGIGDLIQKGKLFVGKAPKTKKIKPAVDPKLIQQESIKDVYKRLMRSNREAVKGFKKRNEAKKDLGDRLKDYKGDPDAMANGGSPNLPFPFFFEGARPGGTPYPSLDYYDDDFGVKGLMKRRKKKKKKREKKATGGMANISQTYDNNPTLQAQYPNKQDYLDLFSSQTTTTTPQTNTTTQATTSTIAPINPIKPIIKIPQDGGDGGGGITSIDKGLTVADDYGFGVANQTGMGYQLTEKDLEDIDDARLMSGIKSIGYDLKQLGKFSPFNIAKAGLKKGQDFALDLIQKAKDAAAARELAKLQEAARAAGFQGDTRTDAETSFASSQTYGGGGTGRDQGADTFDI